MVKKSNELTIRFFPVKALYSLCTLNDLRVPEKGAQRTQRTTKSTKDNIMETFLVMNTSKLLLTKGRTALLLKDKNIALPLLFW